jgi:hypothetical protein
MMEPMQVAGRHVLGEATVRHRRRTKVKAEDRFWQMDTVATRLAAPPIPDNRTAATPEGRKRLPSECYLG